MSEVIEIKKVEHKQSRGGKSFVSIQDVNNKYYTCWEEKLFPKLKEEETVEVEVFRSKSGDKTFYTIYEKGTPPPQKKGYNKPQATGGQTMDLIKKLEEIEKKIDNIVSKVDKTKKEVDEITNEISKITSALSVNL